MIRKVKYQVKGQYKYPGMETQKPFEVEVEFTLYPPKEGEQFYGTGCYMGVDFNNGNEDYVDARYAGTKDLVTLATRYIKNYWGDNLKEYHYID